jgi:hypothetical protein
VPQHSMAYALGLVALAVVNAAGSAAPIGAIALAGLALGGATMMNPFVGAIFSLAWGGGVIFNALGSGEFVKRMLRHSVAVVPIGLALAWCIGNQMVEGGGSALQFGWLGEARNAPLLTLILSLGPALLPAIVGLFSRPRLETGALLTGLSLLLMFFVRLNVDTAWVGFRAGQMFLVAVPVLIARGFVSTGAWRHIAIATAVLALLAGTPTTVIDAYNAQDITNFSQGPIGPWTVTVTRDETEGLDWLRRETPAAAIVQMDPMARERQTWSLIPSFAQRRMAAGRPISLLGGTDARSEYADKSAQVKTMYAIDNAQQARDIARSLRIDYVWVDRVERGAYPSGVAKFDAAPALFAPAFKNGEVSIYRVQ